MSPASGHFNYQWEAENLIRLSPYSWVTTHTKIGEIGELLDRINKNLNFESSTSNFDISPCQTFGKKIAGGVECLH